MQYEKWEEILNLINSKFEVKDKGEYAGEHESKIEYIEFVQGEKEIKLEFITKPKLLEKQTIYSKRVGARGQEKYVYDNKEKVHIFKAYKMNPNSFDWEEIDSNIFN